MQTEISIKDLLGIAQKYLILLLVVTLCAGLLGFAFTQFLVDPEYTATAKMYVYSDKETGSQNSSELSYAKSLVKTYSVIIRSDTVMQKVVDEVVADYPELTLKQVQEMVSVAGIDDTEAFGISVTATDPKMAAAICNVITEKAPEEVIRVVKAGDVQLIDPAKVPTTAYHPVVRNTAIAALVALVIAYAICFLYTMMDTKVYSREELTNNFDVPILGVIPDNNVTGGKGRSNKTARHSTIQEDRLRLLTSKSPFNVAEAYRMMRTSISYLPIESKCKKLAVTSSAVSEGKTTTSTNLSIALAKNGAKVLLIDADMRKPRIRKLLGVKSKTGLSEYIAGLTEEPPVQETMFRNLSLIVSGKTSANAAELLASHRLNEMISKLEDRFDYIVLDMPPVNVVTDAGVVSKLVDGYVLAVYSRYSEIAAIKAAVETLKQLDARIFGFVLNGVDPKSYAYGGKYGKYGGGKYGYYSYSQHGYGDAAATETVAQPKEPAKVAAKPAAKKEGTANTKAVVDQDGSL